MGQLQAHVLAAHGVENQHVAGVEAHTHCIAFTYPGGRVDACNERAPVLLFWRKAKFLRQSDLLEFTQRDIGMDEEIRAQPFNDLGFGPDVQSALQSAVVWHNLQVIGTKTRGQRAWRRLEAAAQS